MFDVICKCEACDVLFIDAQEPQFCYDCELSFSETESALAEAYLDAQFEEAYQRYCDAR